MVKKVEWGEEKSKDVCVNAAHPPVRVRAGLGNIIFLGVEFGRKRE